MGLTKTTATPRKAARGTEVAMPGRVRQGLAPAERLGWLGALTLLIYGVFVSRFLLRANFYVPFQTIGSLTSYTAVAAVATVLTFSALFVIYLAGYRIILRHGSSLARSRIVWVLVAGCAAAFAVILWLMYPVGSNDIWDYIARGRLTAVHGVNPFVWVPAQFPYDALERYAAWKNDRSAYGPLWELLAAGMARLAGNGVVANVLIFKLAAIVSLAVDAELIRRILAKVAPGRELAGVYLFTWNPLVLWEIAGNGHNDAIMLLTILLAVYFYVTRRHTASIGALAAGVLIKFLPAFLAPLFLIGALRREPPGRRLPFFIRSGLLSLGLAILAYAPFISGMRSFTPVDHLGLTTSSIPSLAIGTLSAVVPATTASGIVGTLTLGMLALAVLYRTWRIDTGDLAPARASWAVLALYVAVLSSWLWPWYAIWVFGLAVLFDDRLAVRSSLLLTYAFTFRYILDNFIATPRAGLAQFPARDVLAVLMTLLPPLAYFAFEWARGRGGEPVSVEAEEADLLERAA